MVTKYSISVDDAFRRAAGECKDLERRHEAAVNSVLRLRKSYEAAQAKEQDLAFQLAEAEARKRAAGAAVARMSKPGEAAQPGERGASEDEPLFSVT